MWSVLKLQLHVHHAWSNNVCLILMALMAPASHHCKPDMLTNRHSYCFNMCSANPVWPVFVSVDQHALASSRGPRSFALPLVNIALLKACTLANLLTLLIHAC